MLKYWKFVFDQAVRAALSELRWTTPGRFLLAIAALVVSGITVSLATEKTPFSALGTGLGTILVLVIWFLWFVASIPPKIDAKLKSRILPGPDDEQPLFKVIECWHNQVGNKREAYVKIRYTSNIRDGELKIWGLSLTEKILVEGHASVNQLSGHVHQAPLASVPIMNDGSVPQWAHGRGQFNFDEPQLVVIEMKAGEIRQEYRIDLRAISSTSQQRMVVTAPEANPYFRPERNAASGAA